MMTSPDFTSILQGSQTNSNKNEWEFDICKENISNIENITFSLTITVSIDKESSIELTVVDTCD